VRDAQIRPAGPADLDAVVRCQDACWREAYTGLMPGDYLDDREHTGRAFVRWQTRLAGGRQVHLAVVDTGEVVGVASTGPSRDPVPEPPLELKSLYVRAQYHGTGLASRLLDAAIGDAPASLWVYEANARARAFYAKHGFGPDDARIVDDDTGLWMVRLVRTRWS
jgi:GNAT superfamily N-acetyltransferase